MAVAWLTKLFNILGENDRRMEEKYLGSNTATITEEENPEKNDDRVPRDELMYFMRKSGVAEKLLNAVKNVYEENITSLRFVTGTTEDFRAKVGLHQGSAPSPVLFPY
ncbi:uncharacterized protein LOC125039838 [Penaeus chinensis]|uniref:uncharacterized protein LOC125039838 n=1 Tax=Penaeus chinensis TaxID=139456 RepID=UPI001FB6D490|nr:uncharacterized protein LOC125039838 [Penaeus chinensis]